MHKIEGARAVDDVWTDTQTALEAMEARFANSGGGGGVCAHVYANAAESIGSGDLASRINAAAASRFGEGKVTLSARTLQVDASHKAFGMDALRSFD